jgi:predicted secreted hydrolase
MRLRVGDRAFALAPLFDDQELDSRRSSGTTYWEGAMRALEDGRPVGQGYLELTGYRDPLRF